MSGSYVNYITGLKQVKWWIYTATSIALYFHKTFWHETSYLKIYLKNKQQKWVIFIFEYIFLYERYFHNLT